MTEFPVTLITACVLGIAYAGLSLAVGRQRGEANVSLGLGKDASVAIGEEYKAPPLLVPSAGTRNSPNTCRFPYCLFCFSNSMADRAILIGLAVALMLSRFCMALGLGRTTPNPLRTAGNLLQWGMIAVASAFGLVLAI